MLIHVDADYACQRCLSKLDHGPGVHLQLALTKLVKSYIQVMCTHLINMLSHAVK